MKEYIKNTLERYNKLEKEITTQEWDRIAIKENLLSTKSLKYLYGIKFKTERKRRNIKKNELA